MRAWKGFLPALAYAALIFALSAQSHPLAFLPPELLLQDKLLHALEYAALGALLVPGFRLAGLSPRGALLAAIAAASLYGATDEFHQSFVPGRSADVLDWVADTLGATVGAAAATGLLALRRARSAG
ncbi:MAG TPA: VanZ family protein [Anaeromyxobacteraceae bacterium]|nr:VanZ family protein [Anaeromyxobacteraceae bacterium]